MLHARENALCKHAVFIVFMCTQLREHDRHRHHHQHHHQPPAAPRRCTTGAPASCSDRRLTKGPEG